MKHEYLFSQYRSQRARLLVLDLEYRKQKDKLYLSEQYNFRDLELAVLQAVFQVVFQVDPKLALEWEW